jgi:peroxiredoxin
MAFPKVGNLAPKFSLQDHEDNTVALADFKGKSAVVVYF